MISENDKGPAIDSAIRAAWQAPSERYRRGDGSRALH
jgi:hypothetical protein